ncbi:hypothetical protein HID58_093607 [Brassica napus]|uniref:Uncharacterized protein n=3 Tax=Brassica napus TaxID=3708 RepID=A0ABQ7X5M9_BRANA|nr:hypothetical protein HID58_095337 [Brassica napus]KAH0852930.1 hypothetical protein HID58_093607 [Brassica napus]
MTVASSVSSLYLISNLNFKTSLLSQISFSVCASTQPISGVVFKPFVEVKKELDLVPSSPELSLARHMYSLECEAAVNEQVFQGLKCGRKRPRKMLMDQQEKRGGRVQLKPMVMPQSKFDYADKGDVVYGKALSLSSINHGVGSIIGETGQCEAPIRFLQRWVPNITTKFLFKDGFMGIVK